MVELIKKRNRQEIAAAKEKSSTKWASIDKVGEEKKKPIQTTKGIQKTTEHQSKVQEAYQKKFGSTGDVMRIIAISLSGCSISLLGISIKF